MGGATKSVHCQLGSAAMGWIDPLPEDGLVQPTIGRLVRTIKKFFFLCAARYGSSWPGQAAVGWILTVHCPRQGTANCAQTLSAVARSSCAFIKKNESGAAKPGQQWQDLVTPLKN